MNDRKFKAGWVATGLILLIVTAAVLITWQATRPHQTINSLSDVPPKGAGRFERN